MNFSLQEQRKSLCFTEPSLAGQPEQQTAQSKHQNTKQRSDLDRQQCFRQTDGEKY